VKSLQSLRRFYAQYVTAIAGIDNPRITDAYAEVAREDFVGPGPWHVRVHDGYIVTETDDPCVLYQDILIGLVPEKHINNGEPSFHARCLAEADPQVGEVVIHVGAGTGYYTAILAHLVKQSGHVHAYEIEPELAARALRNLQPQGNVTVRAHSALLSGLPSADVIYVSAGATHVPAVWLDALALGGRLVLPLTPEEREGCMLIVTRTLDAAYTARIFSTAAFVPCIGARDEAQSKAVAAALDTSAGEAVRSLRRGDQPDASAWCIGADWWLSTESVSPGSPVMSNVSRL
jgi:protein-L-isoaspartate(D-aspartate) O-methyltransferase